MKKILSSFNFYVLFALALSAASALIYEVTATHVLFYYYIESSYSISTVLSVFMLGLGIGSYCVYKVLPKIINKERFFGLIQLCIGIYAVVVIVRLDQIVPRVSDWGVLGTSTLILLLPTIFLGAAFPMAAALFRKEDRDVTGLVYSADLIGAVLGSIISGFILIPHLGNGLTAIIGAGLNFVSAIIVFRNFKDKKLIIIPVLLIISSMALIYFYPKYLTDNKITQDTSNKSYFSNSPYGPVRVINKTLFVNSKEMCSLNYPETTSEKMMVDYALDPLEKYDAKVLTIGLGCGLTLEKLSNKTTATIDVVEINPKVVEANRTMTDVLKNKQINLMIDDGLIYLRQTNLKYDSILVDVEDPTVAHSSGLFTVEAFSTIAQALNDHGTLAFWNYSKKKGEYYDILYYSLKQSFSHVYDYPGVFVASQKLFPGEEYQPTTPYKINTLDKNTLTDAFLKE